MESNKVKLPKEMFEAVEFLRNEGFSNYAIITGLDSKTHILQSKIDVINSYLGQEGMHPDYLIDGLVNGYELEVTPEDKVKEIYDYFGQPEIHFASVDIQNKIEVMLNFLGITIEGVNDHE